MKFAMTYYETLGTTYLVDADSYEDALEKMRRAVEDGTITLDVSDYIDDSGEIEGCPAETYDYNYPVLNDSYKN